MSVRTRKRGLDVPPKVRDSKLQMRDMPIGSLKLDPENVKKHSEAQINQIMGSITKFGFGDPVGVTPLGKVLEGHGRIEAARRLGIQTIPVVIVSGLSPAEERAYAIAHNQTNMNSGLDIGVVSDEFARLGIVETDYGYLGFHPTDFIRVDADTSKDHNGHDVDDGKHLPKVIKTGMKFENEKQLATWDSLITRCREVFGGETIAERLVEFVEVTEGTLTDG